MFRGNPFFNVNGANTSCQKSLQSPKALNCRIIDQIKQEPKRAFSISPSFFELLSIPELIKVSTAFYNNVAPCSSSTLYICIGNIAPDPELRNACEKAI